MGYAVWLVPAQREREALQQFMDFRPRTYRRKAGSRSYPKLVPHITLITFNARACPSLDSILPRSTEVAIASFIQMHRGDSYRGAMGITVAKTPELLELHDRVKRRMEQFHDIETKSGRFPHMSLFYVDEDEERDRLERHLAHSKLVRTRTGGNGVALTCGFADGTFAEIKEFSAEEVWLVDCNSSDVREWSVMEKRLIARRGAAVEVPQEVETFRISEQGEVRQSPVSQRPTETGGGPRAEMQARVRPPQRSSTLRTPPALTVTEPEPAPTAVMRTPPVSWRNQPMSAVYHSPMTLRSAYSTGSAIGAVPTDQYYAMPEANPPTSSSNTKESAAPTPTTTHRHMRTHRRRSLPNLKAKDPASNTAQAVNDICLICKQRVKRKNHQFCSHRCTSIAAQRAPELVPVPKGHVMYNDVKKSFVENWKDKGPKPTITAIYLLTWTREMRKSFDKYREAIAKKRTLSLTEVKRFRSEKRSCHLGDSKKNLKFCKRKSCQLCRAIRSAFKDTLKFKRGLVKKKSSRGVRFGAGIYISPTSNRAFDYAKNVAGCRSSQLAILSVRCVLGKVQRFPDGYEDNGRLKPNRGYDSVEGYAANGQKELVVYDSDAVRPAYLIMCK